MKNALLFSVQASLDESGVEQKHVHSKRSIVDVFVLTTNTPGSSIFIDLIHLLLLNPGLAGVIIQMTTCGNRSKVAYTALAGFEVNDIRFYSSPDHIAATSDQVVSHYFFSLSGLNVGHFDEVAYLAHSAKIPFYY